MAVWTVWRHHCTIYMRRQGIGSARSGAWTGKLDGVRREEMRAVNCASAELEQTKQPIFGRDSKMAISVGRDDPLAYKQVKKGRMEGRRRDIPTCFWGERGER